jgi:hypothetical protein
MRLLLVEDDTMIGEVVLDLLGPSTTPSTGSRTAKWPTRP